VDLLEWDPIICCGPRAVSYSSLTPVAILYTGHAAVRIGSVVTDVDVVAKQHDRTRKYSCPVRQFSSVRDHPGHRNLARGLHDRRMQGQLRLGGRSGRCMEEL
jgi:hypothetical protein